MRCTSVLALYVALVFSGCSFDFIGSGDDSDKGGPGIDGNKPQDITEMTHKTYKEYTKAFANP